MQTTMVAKKNKTAHGSPQQLRSKISDATATKTRSKKSLSPIDGVVARTSGQEDSAVLTRILANESKVQQLEQLCGALGWGRRIFYEKGPGWVAEVTCGLLDKVRVDSGHHEPRTKNGEKAGRAAAAAKAMEALRDRAASALSAPTVPLMEAFPDIHNVEIIAADPDGWARLRKSLGCKEGRTKPCVVGVSTEGNDGCGAPLLVQIAFHDLVLVEMPRSRPSGNLSSNLKRLLGDDSVTKVFCDSAGRRDMHSLGLSDLVASTNAPGSRSIADLEAMATECFGPPAAHRGLPRIAGLVFGQRISKGEMIDWAALERADVPLRRLQDVPSNALRYAAAEALCTLKTWEVLHEAVRDHRRSEALEASRILKSVDDDVAVDEEEAELQALDSEIAALQDQLLGLNHSQAKRKASPSHRAVASGAVRPQSGDARSQVDGPSRRSSNRITAQTPPPGVEHASRKRVHGSVGGGEASEKWCGWRVALDSELAVAGGAAPWPHVQRALISRRRRCTSASDVDETIWRVEALASIPLHYLSTSSNLVTLPSTP